MPLLKAGQRSSPRWKTSWVILLFVHSVNNHGDHVASVVSSAGGIKVTKDTIPALQEGAHGFGLDPPTLTFLSAVMALAKTPQDRASTRGRKHAGTECPCLRRRGDREAAALWHPSSCPQSDANTVLAGETQFNDNTVPSAAAAPQKPSFCLGHPVEKKRCISGGRGFDFPVWM